MDAMGRRKQKDSLRLLTADVSQPELFVFLLKTARIIHNVAFG
jgi:hypothetical protein